MRNKILEKILDGLWELENFFEKTKNRKARIVTTDYEVSGYATTELMGGDGRLLSYNEVDPYKSLRNIFGEISAIKQRGPFEGEIVEGENDDYTIDFALFNGQRVRLNRRIGSERHLRDGSVYPTIKARISLKGLEDKSGYVRRILGNVGSVSELRSYVNLEFMGLDAYKMPVVERIR